MTIEDQIDPFKRYNIDKSGSNIGKLIPSNDSELINLFMNYWVQIFDDVPEYKRGKDWSFNRLFTYDEYEKWYDGEPQKLLDAVSSRIYGFRSQYDRSHRGYCQAILNISQVYTPKVAEFFYKPLSARIPIANRKRHGYIVGKTGTGKSTILKNLILEDIKRNDGSVLVIDPKGDLAREIAQFKEFAPGQPHHDRLVYINPTQFSDVTPVFNPFDQLDNISIASTAMKDTMVSLFREMGNSSDFSGAMEAMLYHFIWLMCEKENMNLIDMYKLADPGVRIKEKMVVPPDNERLVRKGEELSNEMSRDYFKNKFRIANHTTKQGIEWRIGAFLQDPLLQRCTTGKSTIHLKDLLDKKKVVVVNLAKGAMGAGASVLFGKMLLCYLQIIGQERYELQPNQRPQTWAFVDEFQNYITAASEVIFAEGRSGGIAFCGAQQVVMQGMNKGFYDVMMANTDFKIVSQSTVENWDAMEKQLGIERPVFMNQDIYTYLVKVGNGKTFLIDETNTLVVDNNNAMTEEQWREVLEYQRREYYIEPTPLFAIEKEKIKEAEEAEEAERLEKPKNNSLPVDLS